MPVERAVVVPLPLLAELAAHEQQLLARMGPHEGVAGAQVGELLPAVARHLAEQRALAVDDFVVRSEERRVGKECVSKCSSRQSPAYLTNTHNTTTHE